MDGAVRVVGAETLRDTEGIYEMAQERAGRGWINLKVEWIVRAWKIK